MQGGEEVWHEGGLCGVLELLAIYILEPAICSKFVPLFVGKLKDVNIYAQPKLHSVPASADEPACLCIAGGMFKYHGHTF